MSNAPEAALPSCNCFCISKRLFCSSIRFPPKQTTHTLSFLPLLHHHRHAYLMTAECEFPRGPFHFVSLVFTLNLDLFPFPGFPFLLQNLLALHPILAPEVRLAFSYRLNSSSFAICFICAFV